MEASRVERLRKLQKQLGKLEMGEKRLELVGEDDDPSAGFVRPFRVRESRHLDHHSRHHCVCEWCVHGFGLET